MKRQRTRKGAHGIVDVARRAGVSAATVSRFYNHPDVVRLNTRMRIKKAAKDLGYIRDRMAGSLHNRFTGTIGVVIPTIDNAIFAEFVEAFSNRLRHHDRTMLIASHGYDLSMEVSIIRSLLERRIDGVVLIGFDHDPIALSMLEDRGVPIVFAWNFDSKSKHPCIGARNQQAAQLITSHVIDLGHTDICFIFPDTKLNDRARERKLGALATGKNAGLQPPESRILTCPYDISAAKKLARIILSKNPPTAIVCGNDVIAHGVIYAAQSMGIKIPDELSVAGIGDFRGSRDMEPGLTTVRIPAKRIGFLAADTIFAISSSGAGTLPQHQLVEISLIVRKSTQEI
ncbi:Transcriptional regulator, LacI family [hydrothermal vent metagenome]|uniref:Transcriptional regulator, LacI family n=1 Tax=hydrothermal vent metagenome TaxID=652676 RepID=A0A3B0S8S8_9ZZZZ